MILKPIVAMPLNQVCPKCRAIAGIEGHVCGSIIGWDGQAPAVDIHVGSLGSISRDSTKRDKFLDKQAEAPHVIGGHRAAGRL